METHFKIKLKGNKIEKELIPLDIDLENQKKLDDIVKKTGYSQNELINFMIDHCLENIEFED